MKKPSKNPIGSEAWFHEVGDRVEDDFWANWDANKKRASDDLAKKAKASDKSKKD